jgi:hypothetical protein
MASLLQFDDIHGRGERGCVSWGCMRKEDEDEYKAAQSLCLAQPRACVCCAFKAFLLLFGLHG